MNNRIPLKQEDTSIEVLARIAKFEARKYDCTVDIDFSGNKRDILLNGNRTCGPMIMDDLREIFR